MPRQIEFTRARNGGNFFVENFVAGPARPMALLSSAADQRGLAPSERRDGANLVVLNTCTVTAKPTRTLVRRFDAYIGKILRARSWSPAAYAQRAPQEIADLPA